ncbi:hypothetical protein ASD28_02670 [Massilia sp. Root133]|uniref:hypothetical protein n=1 Tax=unclassified Massilia TaxID=2609279 RepID=UPI0006F3B6FD|nr:MULTISPECIES: hypothetical protein [unclassified Massilia]KQY19066.1 hypothetical protein ASD28_02670 [Massilia sp. Root133]KQZ53385.1 hypothetical protein ASD92_10175 [Massilia sp. Root1485]
MPPGPHPIHTLELRVREIEQLFNSLDPSPLLNKDLDRSCEAFIESWALALPHESRLQLTIFVEKIESTAKACELVSDAIHNYYRYKAEMVRYELRQLLRQGRMSLAIGVAFVCVCLFLAEVAGGLIPSPTQSIVRESLTIIGWVAMWRPVQIFLYDWWPLKGRIRVFDNLRFARVSIIEA